MNIGFGSNSDCPYWKGKAISEIENTIENTEFLILAKRYMLLVPPTTTLTGSFEK